MTDQSSKRSIKLRSVFISDVHLGSRSCRVDYLHDFLKKIDIEYLYLVGDIVDLWSMKRSFFWPQEHNNIVRILLSKAKQGTKVIYIPGNHDEPFRDFVGHDFGNLQVRKDAIHVTADGRNILVLHGDEFDGEIKCAAWLGLLGHHAYELILYLNRRLNWLRRKLGFDYWSLASYLKSKTKTAEKYIDRFENSATDTARRQGLDGVICGHIHRPKVHTLGGLLYMNCGDWQESCTTLIESQDGEITLMHWSDRQNVVTAEGDPMQFSVLLEKVLDNAA